MAHRLNESDLLAWIEGEPLAAEQADAIRSALDADPGLKQWAHAARQDRQRLRTLAEIEAAGAPVGLAAAAVEIAEREWLVGDPFEPRVHTRRIRITPVRFVAAASVVIIAGAASLTGFLLGPPQHQPQNQFAQSPQADPMDGMLAMAGPRQEPRAASEWRDPITADAGAVDSLAQLAMGAAPTTETFNAATDETAAPVSMRAASAPAKPASSGLTFRLIHPAEHAPDHAVAPDRAAELAREGRLLLLIRTSDPAAVEQALLSRVSDAAAARWRPISELGGVGDGASPGSDAARVALVDVFATPAALEQLIGEVTAGGLSTQGAWLQEMADSVRLEPRFETEDLFFWNRPTTAWAPRMTIPVLIERVATEPDEALPAPDLAP